MNENDKGLEYDDDEAVKFIQESMPNELKGQLTDDDINYIVDLIYEFYEDKGFLDDDADDSIEFDEEELVEYIIKNAKADNEASFTEEQVQAVIEGEIAYTDTLDLD